MGRSVIVSFRRIVCCCNFIWWILPFATQPSERDGVTQPYLSCVLTRLRKASSARRRENSREGRDGARATRPCPFTTDAANCITTASTVYADAQPRGVSNSIQIAPPVKIDSSCKKYHLYLIQQFLSTWDTIRVQIIISHTIEELFI